MKNVNLPRWEELPTIGLYMDQTLEFINYHLEFLNEITGEKLTKTMVNNYVKVGIIEAPVNKRYTTHHLGYLIAVCILKQAFSIQEINKLIKFQISTSKSSKGYNSFCQKFEDALNSATSADEDLNVVKSSDENGRILRITVSVIANKLYIQDFISKSTHEISR